MTATGNGNTLSIDNSTLSMSMTVVPGYSNAITLQHQRRRRGIPDRRPVDAAEQARLGLQTPARRAWWHGGTLNDLASGGAASLANDPTKAASIIDEASSQVTSLRGQLGAFQSSTLNSNISSLDAAVQNLTSAQSSIQDTDFAAASRPDAEPSARAVGHGGVVHRQPHPGQRLSLLKQ